MRVWPIIAASSAEWAGVHVSENFSEIGMESWLYPLTLLNGGGHSLSRGKTFFRQIFFFQLLLKLDFFHAPLEARFFFHKQLKVRFFKIVF